MNYYLEVLKKYCVLDGRARRKEYWFFILFNFLFGIIAELLDYKLGTTYTMEGISLGYGIIYTIYELAVLLPSIGVLVRRLHDIGKGGQWVFIVLIPIVGWIWIIVLTCTDSQLGDNRFGENPKGISFD